MLVALLHYHWLALMSHVAALPLCLPQGVNVGDAHNELLTSFAERDDVTQFMKVGVWCTLISTTKHIINFNVVVFRPVHNTRQRMLYIDLGSILVSAASTCCIVTVMLHCDHTFEL